MGHSNGWSLRCRDAVPKQCCGLSSPPVRWSILGVGVVGLVCAGAGALLGALRASGRDHIAVALLMIGKNGHSLVTRFSVLSYFIFYIIFNQCNDSNGVSFSKVTIDAQFIDP